MIALRLNFTRLNLNINVHGRRYCIDRCCWRRSIISWCGVGRNCGQFCVYLFTEIGTFPILSTVNDPIEAA
ncbi:hypothetical protein AAHA92_32279 [Salvia divinorum]|uniref:Uncharacterized protein n=1 Tax=Salvia divinorum TaxID=28513 RepID=A0ABD1FL67_SALDI